MCLTETGSWISIIIFLVIQVSFVDLIATDTTTPHINNPLVNNSGEKINKTNITIGYLTVVKTVKYIRGRQGKIISGAISYALKLINEDPNLLPNYHLSLIWNDTKAETLLGTKQLTEQWKSGAVAFIGLEDSCSVEARVAAAWDLPMISYVSFDVCLV